jgi:hypothetical protein
VTTAVLSAALAAAAFAAQWLPWLPVVAAALLALLIAAGWPWLLGGPAPAGPAIVVTGAGLAAVAIAWQIDDEPALRHLPIVLALGLFLAFVAELLRRDGRSRLVASVGGTVSGVFVAVAASGWVAAARLGSGLVVVTAAAIAVGGALSARGAASRWSGAGLATVVAGIAGAVLGALVPDTSLLLGLVAGAMCGLAVGALQLLFERDTPGATTFARLRSGVAAATAPVAVGGMLVFTVTVLLG